MEKRKNRINYSINFLGRLFYKVILKYINECSDEIIVSFKFNEKTKRGTTLRDKIPRDIERVILNELNKRSISLINKKYSIATCSVYDINVVDLLVKLQVKLTKNKNKEKALLGYSKLEKTKTDWFVSIYEKRG